ncbi:MAG: hypothetical protein ACE364_07045 [Chlorobiota bacterium]
MGFGFNLFFIFILVPLTGILLIAWLLSRKLWIGKTLGFIWLGILGIALLFGIVQWLTSKTELSKKDYYGEYVINRDYFVGEQTDWQYNHFRFEITDEDSIFFYVTDKEKILKTYRGTIITTTSYSSARLIIAMEQPTHHILSSNPTTYRSSWDFYLVFESSKFYNVFFEKGKWKPIE